MQLFANNAKTTLIADCSESDTEISVASIAEFPYLTADDYFLVTLESGDQREIVSVVARYTGSFAVERAQEGTTAQAWAVGTTVSLRVTAGTMAALCGAAQGADIQQLDQGGDERGTSALNLQTGRTNDAYVASGDYATALGYQSKASGQHSFAVGYGANADNYGLAIGQNSTAGAGSIALNGNAGGAANLAIFGTTVKADGSRPSNSMVVGQSAVAKDDFCLVVGHSASAHAAHSVAVGADTYAAGADSLALGRAARTYGLGSFSARAVAFPDASICMYGFHVLPQSDGVSAAERGNSSTVTAFATPYVDLGVPATWAASTEYENGAVVRPTTGGSTQYLARVARNDAAAGHNATVTSAETEPVWANEEQIDTEDPEFPPGGVWSAGIDWAAGYETAVIPDHVTFFPTEVLFVSHLHETLTGTPTISVGTSTNATAFLNTASVTLAAAPGVQRFTLPNPGIGVAAGDNLVITVEAAATSGRLCGRFVILGFFIENRSNLLG